MRLTGRLGSVLGLDLSAVLGLARFGQLAVLECEMIPLLQLPELTQLRVPS